MQEAEIFDVDGTLCDVASVRHHVRGPHRNFDAFHEAALACPPHPHVVEAAHDAVRRGRVVVVVTARRERWRRPTAMWLALHGIPSDHLYLRGDHDGRRDVEVKREILAQVRQRYRVVRAWDDNPAVVALWESEGIDVEVVPGWDESDATARPAGSS